MTENDGGGGGAPPSTATKPLTDLQIGLGDARARAAEREERARADEEAPRSVAFEHPADGRNWTVHIAPSTAAGHLEDEGFSGTPDRDAIEAWVDSHREMLARSAERKIADGAVTGNDVWVHTRDFV